MLSRSRLSVTKRWTSEKTHNDHQVSVVYQASVKNLVAGERLDKKEYLASRNLAVELLSIKVLTTRWRDKKVDVVITVAVGQEDTQEENFGNEEGPGT